MRVLVTGCAGFIGWKVSEQLRRAGHEVLGLDNLNPAYDVRLKQWRLAEVERLDVAFTQLDISDRDVLRRYFASTPLDAVVNLAARAGVRQSLRDPWVYYHTNVTGTLNLLECCRHYGIRKVVLASTSSLYGDGPRPFREDQPTDRPLSPYAASKKAAEVLAFTYHQLYGIDISVLRYFTVYGPAGRPDMSIFRFIRWIAEGEALTLYGDGTQERDFTFVDDIAQGTVLALRPVGYEVVNLGGDRPVQVRTVITLLEQLLGRRAEIDQQPAHPADVRATAADISRARQILGWQPSMTLEDGLAASVAWYREHREWASHLALGE